MLHSSYYMQKKAVHNSVGNKNGKPFSTFFFCSQYRFQIFFRQDKYEYELNCHFDLGVIYDAYLAIANRSFLLYLSSDFFFTKWMMGKNLSFKKKCSTISESDQKETMAVAIWVFCCQWYVHTWWGAKSFGICVNEPRVVFSPRLLSILCRSKNCRTVYLANMQSCMSPPLHATLFCFPKQKRNFSRNRKWQIDSIHYRSTQKA